MKNVNCDPWLEIATAPRDGTLVLIGWYDGPVAIASRQLGAKRTRDGMPTYGHEFPTLNGCYPDRWMPLPLAPQRAAEPGEKATGTAG